MLGSDGMRRKIEEYVRIWETRGYPDGIPDEADPVLENLSRAPSYRAICRAIMKNDYTGIYLGCSRTKDQNIMKQRALERYGKMKLARSKKGGSDK